MWSITKIVYIVYNKIGKTTILRCIVGRVGLDSGEISVLGKEPGARGHGIPGIYLWSFPNPRINWS